MKCPVKRSLFIVLFAVLSIKASRTEETVLPAINDLTAHGIGERIEVRWTTPVPTVSAVEFGHAEDINLRTQEDPFKILVMLF